jgi:glycogen debranching enzyme
VTTTFSVQDIPFSYPGSWFDISPVIAEKTYAADLHLVSHQTGMHPVLRFEPRCGGTRIIAGPAGLRWEHPAGDIEVVYETADTIRLRGAGLGMRIAAAAATLTPFSGTYLYRDPRAAAYVFTSYETGRRYRLTVLGDSSHTATGAEALGTGERHVDLPGGAAWEVVIEEYATSRDPYRATATFDEVARSTADTFGRYLDAVAPWRDARTPAAELATYVLWSAKVAPAGFFGRPAVLMSKHWMDKVWSWDHCFTALALAAGDPDLAWDQFHIPFDHQDPTGALPDSVAHSEVLYNFVKPPIHGWAFAHLRRQLPPLSRDRLTEIYDRLSRWTTFWLTQRRTPGDPLPYYQHGNDSGWDNATTFDAGRVRQTADLTAFLTMQLRELSALATELGDQHAADEWAATAEQLQAAMVSTLWDGSRFLSRRPGTGEMSDSSSLLALMPLVLGADLPAEIRSSLAATLKNHLTPYGLATEPLDSAEYAEDGYWRGPIWAPTTVLIEDGLRRAGQDELADDLSSRFRALCETSGFAENFNAGTGAGLRDRAYTWTAAAYLILAAAHQLRN